MRVSLVADRYRIVEELGRGGMGVVYRARDERLGREVALKTVRTGEDPAVRDRLRREARAAASLSHPNVCQVYDLVEQGEELYVAMELLAGEPLEDRLLRGALPAPEAVAIGEGVLAALAALHERGIVHRDLKPSNVFLTAHGVKVLDFGLALPLGGADLKLTTPGTLVGTPRYMAPEQWRAEPVGPAADLFSCGTLLFEMLAGRPAFEGDSAPAVCHAIIAQHPPALAGGPRIEAVDRVLRRALAKRPDERWPTASAMARALRDAHVQSSATEQLAARPVTRLMVLPFRLLRPDPEIDFLSFGLADALTVALGGLPQLVMRSSLSASKLGDGPPDLAALAAQAEVDAVLFGTLLRAGERVRLQTQLVQVPGGTVLGTATAQATLDDIFALQDELSQEVLQALQLTLTPRQDQRLQQAAPQSGRAYELYLRGNDVRASAASTSQLMAARDLYRGALAEDPEFAPAWARLGRTYRVIAKYGHDEPEENLRLAGEAFRRSLELDPNLPLAHSLYTFYELEQPAGALPAMRRLLAQVASGARDPQIYTGLVAALRFCGLLDASLAAHREAVRLDPRVSSSVHYTYLVRGDYAQAIVHDDEELQGVRLMALAELGRTEEAAAGLRRLEERGLDGGEADWIAAIRAAWEGDPQAVIAGAGHALGGGFRDPEGLFVNARLVARAGGREVALEMLRRAATGFWPVERWEHDPAFDSVRDDPAYQALLPGVRERHAEALQAFRAAGGERLLGLETSAAGEPTRLLASGDASRS